ncbi:MAG: hypothetical protein QOE36_415 [Gaiellaceae bacterium]|jgi:hypothetical protein|nr:hypothetical protein [Gaiellaceae bacterium]MDX6510911.1 hypothetical protein [Gaiellaceae bacterium]
MEHYLAERYLSRLARCDLAVAASRIEAAAAELTREGSATRYVRTIFVPAEETCFYLFEAESADAVASVGGRADLAFERVLEAETHT